MLNIIYTTETMKWLSMKEVRERVIETKSRGGALFLEGRFGFKVSNALLKPAEEFEDVTIRTNYRLPNTIESRSSSITGKPLIGDPRLFGLNQVNPLIAEGFSGLFKIRSHS